MNIRKNPPQLFHRFLRWFCHPALLNSIEGDLIELYHERLKTGKRKADIKFIIDVLLLFRPGIIRPTEGHQNLNTYGMYKSYFKIGWRNLTRNKGYALINIGGLALGMTVAIMIGLWIYDELSFNQYHKNHSRIAKVYRNNTRSFGIQSNSIQTAGLGTLLKAEYGDHFERVALVRARPEERLLTFNDQKFVQKGFFMQPDGPEMLTLEMTKGVRSGLKEKNSILLSESLAEKIFGDTDPINQIITMDTKSDVKVMGVYKDLPNNSEFSEASYLSTIDLWMDGWTDVTVWNNYNVWVFVQISPQGDMNKISSIIKDCMKSHVDDLARSSNPEVFLVPMDDLHLSAQFKDGVSITSDQMKFVKLYGIIGIFVLLLACINFMNLSTARSEKRAKEVGIRKSIGSYRVQLIQQFYSESLLVTFLSFVAAIVLVIVLLPAFNTISGKSIALPWNQPTFWVAGISFTILVGVVAGSYPALFLSSFNTVRVLKGTYKAGRFSSLPRKMLVVTQFTVSIVLAVGTVVVYQQIQYAKSRPVGYTRESLVSMRIMSSEFLSNFESLRNQLKQTGAVLEMGASDYAITSTLGWNGGFEWRGMMKEGDQPAFNINAVTYEYGKTIGWEFVQGRDFSREFPSDKTGVVINETAMKVMGLDIAAGEILTRNREGQFLEFTILGVVRDVVKGSPFEPTDACFYFLNDRNIQWAYFRMNPDMTTAEALAKAEKVFTSIIPSAPFDYRFADEEYEAKFRSEERIGTLAAIFSFFAILISCSGLFGLASFVAERRTKEIGIRKVLGASVSQVWQLLSSEFVLLVAVSIIISVPLSYYLMDNWLQQYKYRTTIGWYIFFFAGTGALSVTLLTVSFQAVKAAMMNPVKSLRSE